MKKLYIFFNSPLIEVNVTDELQTVYNLIYILYYIILYYYIFFNLISY